MNDHIAELKRFHHEQIELHLGQPIGASRSQIADLEKELGGPLPDAYREFLDWIGSDTSGIWRGSDCFVHQIVGNNASLPELLKENKIQFDLPKRFVTFFMHQGYIAAWFDLDAELPDPVCWLFFEGTTEMPTSVGALSAFLLSDLEGLAPHAKHIAP